MKHCLNLIAIIAIALLSFSCSEETSNQPHSRGNVKVVKLSQFLTSPYTRNNPSESEDVLQFEDQESFDETVAMLSAMTDDEKEAYFSEIGFEGAYTIFTRADDELEEIFNMNETDSIAITTKMNSYREKYEGLLVFNSEDDTDMTPNLSFQNENLALVGSISGYVIIGNELFYADDLPFASATTENSYLTEDIEAYETSEIENGLSESKPAITKFPTRSTALGYLCEYIPPVTVKNGHYVSYFRFGNDGPYLAFKVETYRTILCFRKYNYTVGHDAILEIWNRSKGKYAGYLIHHNTGQWRFRNATPIMYAPTMDIKVTNFSCTLNPLNKVSVSKKDVRVK